MASYPVWCRTRQQGSLYECHQYFLRSAYRAVHDPAAPLAPQEKANGRVPITTDVPVLRINHISTKSSLFGVWRTKHLGAVGDPIWSTGAFVCVPELLLKKDRSCDKTYRKRQVCSKSVPCRYPRSCI